MQKKKKSIIIASVVLSVLLLGAVGVFLLTNRQTALKERNLTDIEWYDVDAKEFVITTAQELYDLKVLAEYYDFAGQTVKLGADIVVNEGDAEDWAKKAPVNKWFPICDFAGTFDGQGHTISGLYGVGYGTTMGLFANVKTNATIKDFKLLNSYFAQDGMRPVGSVAANGCGNYEKIYSDAIVTSNGENAGGLIGNVNDDGEASSTAKTSKITNCWFDGKVILTTKMGRYGGGIVGRVFGGTLNLSHCLNSGTISSQSTESNGLYVGGIFGALTYTNYSGAVNLEDSLNVGKIEVPKTTATGSIAGGTIAKTNFKVRDTYTIEQSHTEVCSYAKGVSDGGVPMMNTDFIVGEEWYSWTTLDYDNYWTVTEDSTPVLRCFADKIVDTSGLTKAYSFDWYNANEYEVALETKEDLIGFSLMSYWDTFEAKMVVLAADIVVNEGKATDWAEGKNIPDALWIPIGRTPAFQGTFNGLGHTISGVYGVSGAPFLGLFGWAGNYSEIKNVKVTNSYFETKNVSSGALGSIAGRLEGKIDTTYSDAIITSVGGLVGGIAGYKLTNNVSKITNSWYAGTINMNGDVAKNTGGIMGRLIKGTIEIDNCLFSGTINMGGKKRTINVGGFIGQIAAGTVKIKSSLNSGELVTTEAEKVNASGRVFGQIANSKDITITFEDAYITDKGGTYFWYCSGKDPKIVGGAELKAEKDIFGYDGYRTTGLDFEKYWTVVVNKDGTPILKSFATETPSVAGLTKTFDKSWYDHEKDTYILKDAKDLYGFLYMSNSKMDFKGKTIKLANDIVVNAGNATDWAAGKNIPQKAYNWGAIGKYTNFQGVFDGQGHTISGLYGSTDTAFMGLFGWVGSDGLVKNLKITNSYFESTAESSAAIGSVTGRLEGDIHTVYSDAIITSSAALNGGIAGYKNTNTETPSTITNCWYDGTINMLGDKSKFTGGMMGRIINGSVEVDNCLFSGTFAIGGKTRSVSTGGFVGMVAKNLTITNSLNSGQHIVTEAPKMNSVGRVMGQVSNSDSTKVVIDNTYYTDRSGTYKWYCAGKLPTIIGAAELKKEADVMGYNGFRRTALDFDKYWAVVVNADDTPILKSFASTVPSLAGLEREFDKSWYDPDKTTYVLNDKADLYGFAALLDANVNFKGKTVTLGKDIEVNGGNAEDWANGTVPENIWKPLGKNSAFEGTFDGKGKTISGLYCVEDTPFVGFFGWTGTNSEVKNLRLVNSYFESTCTSKDGAAIGSIAGRCEGDIANVYSNAIITSTGSLNGGLAGYRITSGASKITNCWYDGTINMIGDSSKMTGGIIGRINKGELSIDNCLFSGQINIGGKTRSASTGAFAGGVIAKLKLSNSLNTGSFAFTDVEKVNSVGRVIGQIESNANTDVTVDNVYFTNAGSVPGATYQWYRPQADGVYLSKLTGSGTVVDANNLTGEYAYYYTKLDYETYWALVMKDTNGEDGTPVLKSFATAVPALPLPPSYADISWYDENQTDYTIYDSADLYGLAYLSKTGIDFKGKTIKIADSVNEIKMNTNGTAAEWAAGTITPDYNWEPIGKRVAFAGTFDGNGKTISGLYGKTETPYMGLFGQTAAGSTVKNLKLTNSYFATSTSKYGVAGSIVAFCGGDIENVYSDAIIASSNLVAGGLVGIAWSNGEINIKNSWFNGSITHKQSYTAGIVAWVQNGVATVDNCLNSGIVHYEHANFGNAGGICSNIMMYNWEADREPNSSDKGYATTLHIKNSLNVGQVTNGAQARTGSILGNKSGNTTMTIENVYTTNESFKLNDVSTAVGRGTYTGTVNMVDAIDITGEMAYFNAALDYDNIWALVENGTPVLKKFATTSIPTPQAPAGADISWYNGAESTYVLSDKEDLYGFAYLSEKGMDFAGKTIELEKDITVNTGTVAEWEANSFAGLKQWNPIGTIDKKFAGTFDGKGHSIKGIYISTGKVGAALFRGTTASSEIKNLKLENSYISATGNFAASFVASASGNLTNLYSNAKIVSTKSFSGGIVGQTWTDAGNDIVISGCWFDGTISAPSNIGGILAIGSKGNVELINCLNTGNITYTTNASKPALKWVSGLVGRTLRTSNEWEATEDTTATMSFKMTNCLNLGKLTDSKDKRVGSALGQNNGPSITFANVYTTNESYAYDGTPTSVGRNNSGAVVKYGGINLVAQADITVAGSVTVTNVQSKLVGFDFKNTWAIGKDGTPVLQWAADLGFDTTWYDETATNYTISTAEELYGVSYLSSVGVDFAGKTIALAKDITANDGTVAEWIADNYTGLKTWTPIDKFAGTFDGKNHSIKGIYVNYTDFGAGFFRSTVSGSTIKNLKLENSYINSSKDIVGSVVASCGGNMENVYSSATVKTTGNYAGGLIGQIFSTGTVDIKNCWYAGSFNARSNGAGIVGLAANGTITIENCLNTGSVKTTYDSTGGICGRTFTTGDEWTLSGTGTINLTIKQCLNIGQITGRNNIGSAIGWKQKGTVNAVTVYAAETSTGASTNGVLVGNGTLNSGSITGVKLADITVAGSVKEADVISKLSALDFNLIWGIGANKTPELSWVNGLNADTSWYDEAETSYTINSSKELYGFASLCESGVTFAGKTVKLGADIAVNEKTVAEWKANNYAGLKAWTPIKGFAGTFDGANHTISGIYVKSTELGAGLFKNTVSGSTIKNLKLVNSYINSNKNIVGSIVGSCGGNLTNVYSSATIETTNDFIGGLVGQIFTTGTVNISNCWFDGTVNAKGNAAGLIGLGSNGTAIIENCLNSGSVTVTGDRAGGFIGRTFDSDAEWTTTNDNGSIAITIKKSLNTGEVRGRNYIGSAVGQHQRGNLSIQSAYATENSYGTSTSGVLVGSGTVNNLTKVNLVDITVSNSLTADAILAVINGWGFDTSIWTVKETVGSMPTLK